MQYKSIACHHSPETPPILHVRLSALEVLVATRARGQRLESVVGTGRTVFLLCLGIIVSIVPRARGTALAVASFVYAVAKGCVPQGLCMHGDGRDL